MRTQELEAEQKILLKDKQLLTSAAEKLKNKLQETEEKLQQREDLQRIEQEEMQILRCAIGDLQDKLTALKEVNNNNNNNNNNVKDRRLELCRRTS